MAESADCTICQEPTEDPLGHLKEKHPDKVTTANTLERPKPPRPAFQEGTPWVRYVGWVNDVGEPITVHNPASYAMQGVVGFQEWAYDLVERHLREVSEVAGTPMRPPPITQVKALTRQLLRAADRAQATALRPDGRVDRMAASHTRARGAVRTAVRSHPVPWGATEEEKRVWVRTVTQRAVEILEVAMELLEPDPIEVDQ